MAQQPTTFRPADMATLDDEMVRRLELAISAYFASHPNAADSIEGIRCWWLDPQHTDASEEQVQRALAALVKRGVARRTELPDGHVIYRAGHGTEHGTGHGPERS